jgi:hypothetical protein
MVPGTGTMQATRSWVAVAVGLVGLVIPASAGAATQVGKTFNPDESCPPNSTFLMSGVPGFTVPSNGVITSWRFQAPSTFVPTTLKLKMARHASGNDFTIIGESDPQSPTPSQLNFYPTRIPVLTGDVLGMYMASPDPRFCGHTLVSTTFHKLLDADPPPGTTFTYTMDADFEIDISATVEPDADNDGFGDETQDQCPGQAGPVNGCPEPTDNSAPSTAITKGPKNKTRKKTATFEFTGADTKAIASFQCKLDARAFAPCTSPHTVRVKKGKHTFQVRAIDQAGNVGSPATDTWKRKKKRKK